MRTARLIALGLLLAVLTGCRTNVCCAPASEAPSEPDPVASMVESLDRYAAAGEANTWTTEPLTADPSALGQSARRDAAPAGIPPELLKPGPWEMYGYAVAQSMPGAEFSDESGDVDLWVQRLRLEARKRLAYAALLSFDVVYERADYDFDADFLLPGPDTDPVDPFHSVALRGRMIQPFSEQWGAFLFASAAGESEEDASIFDGMSYAVTGGVGHRFKNGLQLGIGVGLIWRIGGEFFIIPAAQFDWDINDRWNVSLDGPEFEATYKANGCWAFSFAAGFRSRRARLDDGPPGESGIFTDSRIPLQLRAKWTPTTCTLLELRLGFDVYREMFFSDEDGDDTESFRLDPAPNIGLRFRYKF